MPSFPLGSTTNATSFASAGKTYGMRSPLTGNLYVMITNNAGQPELYNGGTTGATWTSTGLILNRSGLQEWSSIFVDEEGYLHIAYRVNTGTHDAIYYRRAGFISGVLSWSTELPLKTAANGGVAGAVYAGLDITVVRASTGQYLALIAAARKSGSSSGVRLFCASITNYGGVWSYAEENWRIQGNSEWLYSGGAVAGRPSVDFQHTGDGVTKSGAHAWVSFNSATGVYLAKASYASGMWTGGSAINLATVAGAAPAVPAKFDGVRYLTTAASGSSVAVYERDSGNTTTTVRTSPAHTAGNIRNHAIAYTASTGDFRVFAVGTSDAVLRYVDYVRATGTWGPWTTVLTTAVMGATADQWGVFRNSHGNARYSVYSAHAGSPNTLTYTSQVIQYAPSTPVITSPTSPGVADVALALTITWAYADQDPTDLQSAYALSRQIGAGTIQYWRASDSTWQSTEQQNSSANNSVTLPIGWGVDADAVHSYKVKVWDSFPLASGYSAATLVTPSTKSNPTVTVPALTEVNVVNDTFTRVAANIHGTTPDTSPANWVADATSVKWSLDGTKAVAQVPQNFFTYIVTAATGEDKRGEWKDIILNTEPSADASRQLWFIVKGVPTDGRYGIYGVLSMTSAGVTIFTVYKRGADLITRVACPTIVGPIPSGQAAYGPFDVSITVVGNVIQAICNGLITEGYLTDDEVTEHAALTHFGMYNYSANVATPVVASIGQVMFKNLTPTTYIEPSITVQWTVASQSAFRITVSETTGAGSAQVHDSGWVTSSTSRSYTIPYIAHDLTTYSVTLQTKNSEGLASNTQSRFVHVDFVEPPQPTIVVTADSPDGMIHLVITNPDPEELEPQLASQEVWRRVVGDTGDGERIKSHLSD